MQRPHRGEWLECVQDPNPCFDKNVEAVFVKKLKLVLVFSPK